MLRSLALMTQIDSLTNERDRRNQITVFQSRVLSPLLLLLLLRLESHQKDHAEGHGGGEDCDGGSCDHLSGIGDVPEVIVDQNMSGNSVKAQHHHVHRSHEAVHRVGEALPLPERSGRANHICSSPEAQQRHEYVAVTQTQTTGHLCKENDRRGRNGAGKEPRLARRRLQLRRIRALHLLMTECTTRGNCCEIHLLLYLCVGGSENEAYLRRKAYN